MTKFEVTQNEFEYAIYQFNKAYDSSENFRKVVNDNPEKRKQAELEKLQSAVILNLCKANHQKLQWLNKNYSVRRSHKDRVIGINDIPYYLKFNITDFPIDDRSKVSITLDKINWCKDNNVNHIIFGIHAINEDSFYFGMIDIDQIPIIGEFHAAGTKRNRNSDFFRDTYQIRLLDLNNLSFENKGAII